MITAEEDLYAVLQVAPDAPPDEIAAAYDRLQNLYSAERLASAPPEFQQLAQQRRADLNAAYAVLHDPARRAVYDLGRSGAPAAEAMDYTPLPPAQRQERPSPSIPLPTIVTPVGERRRGRRSLLPPLLIGGAIVGILLLVILSGVRVQSGARAQATPVVPGLQLPYTRDDILAAERAAQDSTNPDDWVTLGNMLYDNMQTLRESVPLSPQYLNALDQWLAVTQAYSRALELGAGATARADLALAMHNYGIGVNQQVHLDRARAEVERAYAEAPDDPRVLLHYGIIMSGQNPPRIADAQRAWRRILEGAPESREAQTARSLLGEAQD